MKTMRRILLSVVLVGSVSAAVACGGASESGTPADEADIKSQACADVLTLTCKPGFTTSEDGCAQSHVAGAHPFGRCVATPADTCVDILTLTCKAGFTSTEAGCAQSHVAGAHPLGHCVATSPASSTDLGELATPGSVLGGSVRSIQPGQTLSFTAGGNQITGIVGFEIDNTTLVSESDVVVKAMNPGQLGDATFHKYTFTVSKDAPANASIKVTTKPTFQARNDKNWAFSFTIKVP